MVSSVAASSVPGVTTTTTKDGGGVVNTKDAGEDEGLSGVLVALIIMCVLVVVALVAVVAYVTKSHAPPGKVGPAPADVHEVTARPSVGISHRDSLFDMAEHPGAKRGTMDSMNLPLHAPTLPIMRSPSRLNPGPPKKGASVFEDAIFLG